MTPNAHACAALRVRHAPMRTAILAVSAALFLYACAAPGTPTVNRYPGGGYGGAVSAATPSRGNALVQEAENALLRGDGQTASRMFMAAAVDAPADQATDYRLRAAEAALSAGDASRADLLLDQIPAPGNGQSSDPRLQGRYRLQRAQTALARNDPTRALRLLPQGDPGGDPQIAEATLLARAQAQARINDPVSAVSTLVSRERYLSGIVSLGMNRDVLWNLLQTATLDSVTLNRALSAPVVTRGWVELASLARRRAALGDYEGWRQRYPRHPGEEKLASLFAPEWPAAGASSASAADRNPYDFLNQNSGPAAGAGGVALLLPQSGALAVFADAMRAGYSAAARAAGESEPRVYDTGGYAQAVAEGAGVVVGPLLKEALTTVAAIPGLPVPVLGLNYLDANRPAPPGLFQFGLAPEDEARAAAEDAYARGLSRVLTMVPASDWGSRVQTAFAARFRELGGTVADASTYSGGPQSWSEPVKRLLRYVAINDKKDAAAARARVGPGIDPQRRNDFDFVFLAGRASQARVLWPLFRYYHADRTPVYATAAINEGVGDGDLSGIRFCDAPWLLESGGPLQPLHDEALSGRNREAARFYAFGADAQALASRMARNALNGGDLVPGATGVLGVESSGAVRRKLVCARMTNGGDPALLPPPVNDAIPIASP
ncbi:penicillin-binding protein activator [Nevskia sp.]|uniref:penicillin-binding protein activator n=1 Tax=Nevskia sp. TaxID=1929292 RepID=UPI0025FD9EAC|nr:penicillin-binding protein activator [Nevskia sp.]